MKNKIIYCCVFILLNAYFSFLFLISCTDQKQGEAKSKTENNSRGNDKNKPPASYTDTLTIDFPAAVFYYPDSLQFEKIKAITDSMIFDSAVHDCFFQMRNARMVLKKNLPTVKIIETSKARYLQFMKSDKNIIITDLDTKNDMCGIILFNGMKDPVLIDMMNIDSEWDYYFRK